MNMLQKAHLLRYSLEEISGRCRQTMSRRGNAKHFGLVQSRTRHFHFFQLLHLARGSSALEATVGRKDYGQVDYSSLVKTLSLSAVSSILALSGFLSLSHRCRKGGRARSSLVEPVMSSTFNSCSDFTRVCPSTGAFEVCTRECTYFV